LQATARDGMDVGLKDQIKMTRLVGTDPTTRYFKNLTNQTPA
jgi:hypothetical protein